MKKLIIIETVLCVAIVTGVFVCRRTRASGGFAAQDTVDAFVALQPTNDLSQVMQLMTSGSATNKFDVNQYFTVLDALRPEPGYVLDWVYWNRGGGGLPVLYARQINAPPYVSFDNYVALSTNATMGGVRGELHADESFFFGHLDKLHVRDNPEGFFQFVVLRILGDRFHLFWHELYRETFLICSKQGWEALLLHEKERGEPYDPPPAEFIAAASEVDFLPRIRMREEKVEVNVTTYSPFEGLHLHYFSISREYPHTILKHTETNLLRHTQGFVF
ncbi:MAG: hypothetical protein K9N49_02800 [Candidatus Marinimicrobia bacterium]|nr:hypothetical protein [Candidatus Neomarinimicrobiota bacterium]